ncbi:MAG TPA: type 4a pilus biogenesis protein PilO [Coriobacteriia bacterium]|nr:type 4a pilus biogenesis protein PilO [Coriobacteriia bacterium]
MKLSPRYTLILVALGVLAVVVIAAAVLVVPQFRRLSEVETMFASVDDQVTQAETLLQTRQAAKEDAAFTDAELLELAAAVPETPDQPSLIIELQDLAYESAVQIREVEPTDLVQGNGVVAMPMTLTTWGTWTDTVDFVQRLRRMSRQVRIVEVDSGVVDESTTDEGVEDLPPYSVECVLQLETYVIPSAESTSSVPAPPPGQ